MTLAFFDALPLSYSQIESGCLDLNQGPSP